jgi:hypothetical protein
VKGWGRGRWVRGARKENLIYCQPPAGGSLRSSTFKLMRRLRRRNHEKAEGWARGELMTSFNINVFHEKKMHNEERGTSPRSFFGNCFVAKQNNFVLKKRKIGLNVSADTVSADTGLFFLLFL